MKRVILQQSDINYGSLILVNIDTPYIKTEKVNLMPALKNTPHILLERTVANTLTKIIDELSCGDFLVAVSGWRSRAEQEKIYSDSLAQNGESFTRKYVALPDHSEHQTGLAIDLGENLGSIDFIRPTFGYTGVCGDFRNLGSKFGFIERYQKGKEALTNIAHEPWHFRYVGVPHSEIMTQKNLCLEEYLSFLKQNTSSKKPYIHHQNGCDFEVFYLKATPYADTILEVEDNDIYWVSGDNKDGFIVTNRRNV